MIIDIVSDLHGKYPTLEGGDLLILAGDYTASDTEIQYRVFRDWLRSLDYKKKIMVGGNHDMCLFNKSFPFDDEWLGATWLNDSGCEYEGLKLWGSPWTAWFKGINPHCKAWTLTGDEKLAKKWALIPDDTDILITHSPPLGILDEVIHDDKFECVGSESLLYRVLTIKPKFHIFGHIHEGYGRHEANDIEFINASHMDANYFPANKTIRITC